MPLDNISDYSMETALLHFAEEEYKPNGAVVPPIYQSSLFTFPSCEAMEAGYAETPGGPPFFYSRLGNPNLDVVERKVALLEGTERAKAFAGGQAAIATAVFSVMESGAHAVVVDTSYGPTIALFRDYLPRFGCDVTFVDGRDPSSILDALRPETALIYLESPSTMVFRLQDLGLICKIARDRGITTIIDNTYAAGIFQQPIRFGVDIVIHSASKYFSGHSDAMGGFLCTSAERVDRLIRDEISLIGATMAPFTAWLIMRGMRTLHLRLDRHQSSANTLASWLEAHPSVAKVNHVGLESFEQRELFLRQMSGSSGLFTFEPKVQDKAYCFRLVNALKIYQRGVSWGGYESLAIPYNLNLLDPRHPEQWMIRVSVGLESVADLIADFEQAFRIAEA